MTARLSALLGGYVLILTAFSSYASVVMAR